MQKKAFSKIGVIIIFIILIGGGYFTWQYFGVSEEENMVPEVITINYVIVDDILERGHQYTFSWCGGNLASSQKGLSNLYLLKDDINMGLIAENIESKTGYIKCPFWGEYPWEVGKLADNSNVPLGTDYKIKVKFFDLGGKLIAEGESDYFSIISE